MSISFQNLFQEVTTDHDRKTFDELWKDICTEFGVQFIPYHPNSQRFFIMDEQEKVGTIEFTKREPEVFSICEEYFPFEQHDKVLKDRTKVFEVGKISIKKEHRRNGHVDKLIECIHHHATWNKAKQYIGFMNLDLYKILLFSYGLRLERLGNVDKYERHQSIAVLCDVEKAKKRIRKKLST